MFYLYAGTYYGMLPVAKELNVFNPFATGSIIFAPEFNSFHSFRNL